MSSLFRVSLIVAGSLLGAAACRAQAVPVPAPEVDAARSATSGRRAAAVAGGCFWGVQAVSRHVKGVITATSGYAGGAARTADYETVSTGETGHAESVQIVYDPSRFTYGGLLRVFFSVAHDPTQLNRQGPDEGPQYRSSIFCSNEEQRKIAEAYIAQLDAAKVFRHRIVTKVVPLEGF